MAVRSQHLLLYLWIIRLHFKAGLLIKESSLPEGVWLRRIYSLMVCVPAEFKCKLSIMRLRSESEILNCCGVLKYVQHVWAVSLQETQDSLTSNIVHWPAWNSLVKYKYVQCRAQVMNSAVSNTSSSRLSGPRRGKGLPAVPVCQEPAVLASSDHSSWFYLLKLQRFQF